MKTVKMVVEYDGTGYCGWQSQTNGNTVQQHLEKALSRVLDEKVSVTGAGRTDAGVHAAGQVVHFKTESRRSCTAMVRGGNTLLPDDIRILSARYAGSGFHARYGAKGKRYRYTIRTGRSVFDRNGSWYIKQPLDISRMRSAARYLVGTHDFSSFCVVKSRKPDNRCSISAVTVSARGAVITVTVDGNRFLHNMVRIIVGTLVDAGRGRITPSDVPGIINAKDREAAGRTAPAAGLCLLNVKYR